MHVYSGASPGNVAVSNKTERCSTLTWRRSTKLTKSGTEPTADFTVLQFAFQNGELWPIAVLLLDNQDRLHVRARSTADLATRIPAEDVELVALSVHQIAEDARAGDGSKILETLEDQLSNTIRISGRTRTHISDSQKALDRLYELYIAPGE
jgi:hypothetical protein